MLIPNQCCVMCVRILGCSSSWKLTVLLRRRLPRYYAQDLSYLRAPRTWIETLILKKKTEKCFSQDKTQSNSKRRNWNCLQLRLKGQRMRVATEKWEIHVALLQLCPLMSSVQSGVSASNTFSISHEKVDLWKTGFVPSDWFMTIFGAMGCRHIFPFKHLDLEQLFIMGWCARCSVHTICCVRFCFSKTRVTSGVAWSREKYGLSFLWRSCPLFYFNSMWSLDSLQPLPRIYLVSLRKASVEPGSLYSLPPWGCDGRHREKTARACDWSHKHMLHAASRQPHSHKHKHRDSDGSPQPHTGCYDWTPTFQFCTLCDTLYNELWTGKVFCLNVFYWLP